MRNRIAILSILSASLFACVPSHGSITPALESAAPENSAITSISTLAPENANITPVFFKRLEPGKNYIFYISYQGSKGQNHELWAVDPLSGEFFQVAKGINWFLGWSHPGNKWLLSGKHALYVANPDGSNLHMVYEDPQYTFTYSWWLSDNLILINAYSDLQLPPRIYILDLTTEKIDDVTTEDAPKFTAAVSLRNTWIEASWDSGKMQVNDVSNRPYHLFDEMRIRLSPFDSSDIEFLSNADQIIFIASQNADSQQGSSWKLFLASTLNDSLSLLFEAEKNSTINKFRISPDGRYLAFTYSTGKDTFINFLNLQTKKIDYKWVYPYWPDSNSPFFWSPDSKFIVLPYVSSGPWTVPTTRSGIQIMNISNGETKLIVDSQNVRIIDWQSYNK